MGINTILQNILALKLILFSQNQIVLNRLLILMDNNVYLAYYQNTGIIKIINVKIVPTKNIIMPKKKNV